MTVVGMDPKTVYPASSKLQSASTTLNHAAGAAWHELSAPGDIPQAFASDAAAIGGSARTCLTSADAFAVHSVDLADRAKLFEVLEGYSPLTKVARGAALDHFGLLWNPAGRHRSKLQPGDYYNEVDTILHPEKHVPRAPKVPSGCVTERGGEGELTLPGLHVKKTLTGGPQTSTTRTGFNQPGEDGRPGSGRPPLGGADRPDLQSNKGRTIVNSQIGGNYEQKIGVKCTTNLGKGWSLDSELKDFAEAHLLGKVEGGTGGLDGGVNGGATVGVKDTETLHTPYGTLTGSASGQYGLSGDAGYHLQIDDGHVRVGGKFTRVIGLGGTLSGDADIDVKAILGLRHHPEPRPGVPLGSHAGDGTAVITDATRPVHAGIGGGGGGGAR